MVWFKKKSKRSKYHFGETIRVRSKEEIDLALNASSQLDGCLFTDQMYRYCGEEYKIIKIIRSIYNNDRMLTCHANFYMLEGLQCDGNVVSFDNKCDRRCFFLWHEYWLEKIHGH
jgi:hypothetical protein